MSDHLDAVGEWLDKIAGIDPTTIRLCPDGGRCHHRCSVGCFRVANCGPSSNVYPADRWPLEVVYRYQTNDGVL